MQRLKSLGANTDTLVEVYKLFVRSILEFAAPLWDNSITMKSRKMLESVQNLAINIIIPNFNMKNEDKMLALNLLSLKERRLSMTKKLALQMSQNPKFEYLFPKKKCLSTRSQFKFTEPKCSSTRYKSSAIPNFIKLLNNTK